MRFPEKRKRVMKRSIALGHCVCNPKQPCPCDIFREQNLCPCAGEKPDPPKGAVRLTRHVRKAGCASKISRAELNRILPELPLFDDPNVLVGIAAGDDAGVYKIDGEFNLVQTVDVFSPVVDDPFTFGQITAANSVSDIYAMGGRPISALSIIGFPIELLPRQVMIEILRGGIEKMHEAGVSVIGGHSINDEEPKFGFAVTGLIRGAGQVTNSGARPGDRLVLTKPIGTGVISFAAQIGMASPDAVERISRSMAELNRDAAELMVAHGAHACTDITGFGLAGHLSEMLSHSGVTAEIDLANVPVFGEALGCVRAEVIPGGSERNREAYEEGVIATGNGQPALLDLLFDPQTSGGLLVALPKDQVDAYIEAMRERGHDSTHRVGEVIPRQETWIRVALNEPKHLTGEYRLPERTGRDEVACCESPPKAGSESGAFERTEPMEDPMENSARQSAEAFQSLMQSASEGGRVDARTKKLISIALSIAQHCEPCLVHHVQSAFDQGITRAEMDEVAWLATSFTGCTGRMFYLDVMKKIAPE